MRRVSSLGEFNELIENHTVLVNFCASWDQTCKTFSELLHKISEQNEDILFIRVDIDVFVALTNDYNVLSIPTLILFESGNETKRITGLINESKMAQFLK